MCNVAHASACRRGLQSALIRISPMCDVARALACCVDCRVDASSPKRRDDSRLRRLDSLRHVALILALASLAFAQTPTDLPLMPWPATVTRGAGEFTIAQTFTAAISGTGCTHH